MLAAIDLDLMQSVSMAIGVQRQTEMNPITIVIAGINDHLHRAYNGGRCSMASHQRHSRIKGRNNGYTKRRIIHLNDTKSGICVVYGICNLPDGLKFVYAMVALLAEGKYDVIFTAPNREVEAKKLKPLRAELPAVWSDISNAMRGFKDHSLNMLVLDEVYGMELSNFSRQIKLKPGINNDHRVIEAMSNQLWLRGIEIKEEGEKRQNSKETKAHLKAMIVEQNGHGRFRARFGDD